MAQLKSLLLTAVVAALGGAYAQHLFTSREHTVATDTKVAGLDNSATNCSQVTYAAERINAKLQKELADLKAKNQQLLTQISTSTQTSAMPQKIAANQSEEQQQLQQQLRELEMEKQLRKANDFTTWLQKSQEADPQFNLNDNLAQRFAKEQRDPQWAEAQENQYRNLFSDTPELAGFALTNSQCKTRQCELTLSVGSLTESDQLVTRMNEVLANNSKSAVILVVADANTGTTKLYISEDPTSFEFN
uniref:hypothetical protein n=1 Tax=Cellvibrio fontiphilus TaxID=1815559 RepID=UPI002B4BDA15|nr:hypothetical protein [Cellvibrio fontiphilus]